MADRKYEFPPLAFPVGDWRNEIGNTYRLAGIVFQSHIDERIIMMPDTSELGTQITYWNTTPEEWSEILRRSDDPLVFERDETGTVKAWVRKAQYAISGEVQQRIWVRDGLKCMYCMRKMGDVLLTVDHFLPLELGGKNSGENLISSCRPCNKKKGNQHPVDFCYSNNIEYDFLKEYLEIVRKEK